MESFLNIARQEHGFEESTNTRASWLKPELTRYLPTITDGVPQVTGCVTTYCNPDLPKPMGFHETRGEIKGVYRDGTATVMFRVDTTAETEGQRAAMVAALNEWLTSNC